MSLAHKSLDGELRRPAGALQQQNGQPGARWVSSRHRELLCDVPCAGGIKGLPLFWGKSQKKVTFSTHI